MQGTTNLIKHKVRRRRNKKRKGRPIKLTDFEPQTLDSSPAQSNQNQDVHSPFISNLKRNSYEKSPETMNKNPWEEESSSNFILKKATPEEVEFIRQSLTDTISKIVSTNGERKRVLLFSRSKETRITIQKTGPGQIQIWQQPICEIIIPDLIR